MVEERYSGERELLDLIDRYDKLGKALDGFIKEVVALYPTATGKDNRISVFLQLKTVLRCVNFGIRTIHGVVLDPNTSPHVTNASFNPMEAVGLANIFQDFLKVGLLNGSFSVMESFLRVLLNKLAPASCGGKALNGDSFKNVYTTLLDGKIPRFRGDLSANVYLLDAFRLIRNLQHNNGMFYDNDGDRGVAWNGDYFSFKANAPVEIDLHGAANLLREIYGFLYEVVSDSNVTTIIGAVEDPYINSDLVASMDHDFLEHFKDYEGAAPEQ